MMKSHSKRRNAAHHFVLRHSLSTAVNCDPRRSSGLSDPRHTSRSSFLGPVTDQDPIQRAARKRNNQADDAETHDFKYIDSFGRCVRKIATGKCNHDTLHRQKLELSKKTAILSTPHLFTLQYLSNFTMSQLALESAIP